MNFALTDEQTAIVELSARILSEQLPAERLSEIEKTDDAIATDVWNELARADLLGIAMPEAHGGGGYGFFEAALICEQIGRYTAPVPYLPSIVLGGSAVAAFGGDQLQADLLPSVIDGSLILTAALVEDSSGLPPSIPATAAEPDGDGWVLSGTKHLVPAGHVAHRILVPARTGPGASTVFVVDGSAAGLTREVNRSANLEPLTTLTFDGVRVSAADVLGDVGDGAQVVEWITDRAVAAQCAIQAGVCEAATRITAAYTSDRRQFDTPIATFQAVAHRVADAYIDTEAVRLTARQAAWRLGAGVPAAEQVAIAKYWAADGAHRVVHAAQHLHGGIGVDTDYPVHRTYRWAKHGELSFGSGQAHLRRLGALLASSTG